MRRRIQYYYTLLRYLKHISHLYPDGARFPFATKLSESSRTRRTRKLFGWANAVSRAESISDSNGKYDVRMVYYRFMVYIYSLGLSWRDDRGHCIARTVRLWYQNSPSLSCAKPARSGLGKKRGSRAKKQTHHMSQLPALSRYLENPRNMPCRRDSIRSFPSWTLGTKFRAMTMSIQAMGISVPGPRGPIWN